MPAAEVLEEVEQEGSLLKCLRAYSSKSFTLEAFLVFKTGLGVWYKWSYAACTKGWSSPFVKHKVKKWSCAGTWRG